jgi:hypothetical protein
MSSEGVLQWITGCCSPSVGKNEYKGMSVLTRKSERPDANGHASDFPENADVSVVPRNYEDIKDEHVQYFANSEASAGVGIIFQSTKPGYLPPNPPLFGNRPQKRPKPVSKIDHSLLSLLLMKS